MPKATTGHNVEPLPSTSHPYNLFPCKTNCKMVLSSPLRSSKWHLRSTLTTTVLCNFVSFIRATCPDNRKLFNNVCINHQVSPYVTLHFSCTKVKTVHNQPLRSGVLLMVFSSYQSHCSARKLDTPISTDFPGTTGQGTKRSKGQ